MIIFYILQIEQRDQGLLDLVEEGVHVVEEGVDVVEEGVHMVEEGSREEGSRVGG